MYKLKAKATSKSVVPQRQRTRRGNSSDHEALRRRIVEAALSLHAREQDLSSLSMRALAAEVGLSAMGLYRYFESKPALLHAMWEVVLTEAVAFTSAAQLNEATAHARMYAGIEAFMRFWEDRPGYFRLVFMTAETLTPPVEFKLTQTPAYLSALDVGTSTIREVIAEVGGDPARVNEARDLRMALMVGFLHARHANKRFPWGDFDTLRANTSRAIVLGIEACVRRPPMR